jgi:hypothetical protein
MLSVTATGLQHFEFNLRLTVNEDLEHSMEVLKWKELGSGKIFSVCNMLD